MLWVQGAEWDRLLSRSSMGSHSCIQMWFQGQAPFDAVLRAGFIQTQLQPVQPVVG